MTNYIDRDQIRIAGIPVSADECGECYVRVEDVRRAILQVPVADIKEEGAHGSWKILNVRESIVEEVSCTECGRNMTFQDGVGQFRYCPNCGAKMDKICKNLH